MYAYVYVINGGAVKNISQITNNQLVDLEESFKPSLPEVEDIS